LHSREPPERPDLSRSAEQIALPFVTVACTDGNGPPVADFSFSPTLSIKRYVTN
jgi:hypothetical protein